jgi:hypothetical protein
MVRRVLKELSEMVKGLAVADVVDLAQEREEKNTDWAIQRSKANASSMKGEPVCRKCGGPNDRYDLGYVVCSDCVPGAA